MYFKSSTFENVGDVETKISILDSTAPDIQAMIQAMYSRSHISIEDRINSLDEASESGLRKSLKTYYVGYGHDSIADCATTTLFFEHVSILAAKAIQDYSLYNGQESSTRYISFENQPIFNPYLGDDADDVLRDCVNFAMRVQSRLYNEYLDNHINLNPQQEVSEATKRGLNAKAFDVARGFLPTGLATQLSWTTTLRKFKEHIIHLLGHPLSEVRLVANKAAAILAERYPDVFVENLTELAQQRLSDYRSSFESNTGFDINTLYYADVADTNRNVPCFIYSKTDVVHTDIHYSGFEELYISDLAHNFLRNRKKGVAVPEPLSNCGFANVAFMLDYGSFRDIQRHRRGVCQHPVVEPHSTIDSIHTWYLDNLPSDMLHEFEELYRHMYSLYTDIYDPLAIGKDTELGSFRNKIRAQYYTFLGTSIPVSLHYTLPQWIYVLELRTKSTVHPTLRAVMLKIAEKLASTGIKLYIDGRDFSPEVRGAQTIVSK